MNVKEKNKKGRAIKVIVEMKKTIPKNGDWLIHNKTFTPLEEICQAELSRGSGRDGDVFDLEAFEEPENGAVLAEIIVH